MPLAVINSEPRASGWNIKKRMQGAQEQGKNGPEGKYTLSVFMCISKYGIDIGGWIWVGRKHNADNSHVRSQREVVWKRF